MSKELPKAYEAKKYEDKIYQLWEESGFFNPDNLETKGKPYVISMPPPNVTGVLHLGHALENALMDVQIRYQRMKGKKALLLPGTDHAAVATQARVEDDLKKKGIENPREEYGREKLLKIIRDYAEESKSTILTQIKKMGTSCDWSRLAYTFDDQRSLAVNTLFKQMHDDGLIYRGYRVVNWSVLGQSTCSEDELEYKEKETTLYTFKYAADFPIPIATTRPETKLGDTAIAVHPQDKRYKKYIGKKFEVDIGAAKPLSITIISDKNIDPKYGTGALGVTPAHSAVDYEMYQQNKVIGIIQVIDIDGKMTEEAGKDYLGLTTLEARKKFVTKLKKKKLLIKEEKIVHNVGTSDRFKDVVEALPMKQWFVDVNKKIPQHGKTLKELMREAVTTGHKGNKVTIQPERFNKIFLHWIDNLHDWCISRQIWWGHRIPVWYKDEEIFVHEEAPKGKGWKQDEDTLDTWFSSGSWTFSTLGWPEKTKDLKEFHPTTWMQMGYEIIFLWLARMILLSTYALDEIPFKDVYIHGMLRNKQGKKFSKSDRTGVDPLKIIKEYGTDALRFSLLKGVAPGNDSRFYDAKLKDARNFVNKLWNVSRYVLSCDLARIDHNQINTLAEKWIVSRMNNLIKEVTHDLDKCRFSLASEKIYEFLWHEFADWYLEINKKEANPGVLRYCLENILKLLHPYAPFATEVLWKELNPDSLLMIEAWPEVDEKLINLKAEKEFVKFQKAEQEKRIKPEDKKKLKEKAEKQKTELEKYIKGLEKRLNNKSFVDNAPTEVVAMEKERLQEAKKELNKLINT